MRDIPGYEDLYAITEDGKVWSKISTKYLKTRITKKGYESVVFTINRKPVNFFIHRLVALAYIPNPNNLPEINHKDENKLNNSLNNLEWCDRKTNMVYSFGKKVICLEDNIIYESISDCSKKIKAHARWIYDVCNDKKYHHTIYGKHYKFI